MGETGSHDARFNFRARFSARGRWAIGALGPFPPPPQSSPPPFPPFPGPTPHSFPQGPGARGSAGSAGPAGSASVCGACGVCGASVGSAGPRRHQGVSRHGPPRARAPLGPSRRSWEGAPPPEPTGPTGPCSPSPPSPKSSPRVETMTVRSLLTQRLCEWPCRCLRGGTVYTYTQLFPSFTS